MNSELSQTSINAVFFNGNKPIQIVIKNIRDVMKQHMGFDQVKY